MNLTEGLRVVIEQDLRTVIDGEWNVQDVVFPWGVKDRMSVIPAGTVGTIYRFRVRKGLPTCGLPHAEMWGVVFDGVPQPINDHYGLVESRIPDMRIADEQQNSELSALRQAWEAALAKRRECEDRISKSREEQSPYLCNDERLWEDLKLTAKECEDCRERYDRAAGIPQREV